MYRLRDMDIDDKVCEQVEHERWEIELVIDEIKAHERAQRKVLRSKTPEGVIQELYGIFLAHYAVRTLMAQAAIQAHLDPDRLSFSEGLFQLTEMIDLALTDGGQRRPPSHCWGACGTRWSGTGVAPALLACQTPRDQADLQQV